MVLLRVRPFITVTTTRLDTLMSMLSVTPSSVEALVAVNVALFALVIVPLRIFPPFRFQFPVEELIVRVELVLVNVPVKFTVPPVRVHVPRPLVETEPPRFNVPLLTLIVPVLDQLAPMLNVPPLT